MTDEIAKEDEAALTAEYVLGLLSPAETAAFEDVLAVDPALRDEYAFWSERMVALTDDIAPVSPPADSLRQIRATLFHETADTTGSARSWLTRLGLLPAMAGGLLAAVAVLWMVSVFTPGPGPAAPTYVAQIISDDDSLIVQANYDATEQILTVTRDTGTAAPGRALELWLIADGVAPVSLGVLPDAGPARIALDAVLLDDLPGATLAISDEPPGGSITGAPTGAVLATGVVTAV